MAPESASSRAMRFNRECCTLSMDRPALATRLDTDSGSRGLYRTTLLRQPDLLASVPIVVSHLDIERMRALVRAVESIAPTAAFEAEALRSAPATARHAFGPRGVFFGYDFHLTPEGPRLIEINSNAGGAFLSLALARAQRVRCDMLSHMTLGVAPVDHVEREILAMFREEWRLQRGTAPLKTIAIVDERPREQFLYGDFLLCQGMLRRAGYDARVLAPEALTEKDGVLFDGDTPIDLVYNRLTDFYFGDAGNATLQRAYEADGVVVTPHPRAHAGYADKRLLSLLSDAEWLARHGVSRTTAGPLLASIPRTEMLDAGSRARLWRGRSTLVFKPVHGYGSTDVHHGRDLTEAQWAGMPDLAYVAQRVVPPSERTVDVAGRPMALKFDVRAFAYAGEVQQVVARLYQGPTTNLRTIGGGFAPIYVESQDGIDDGRDDQPFACSHECTAGAAAARVH